MVTIINEENEKLIHFKFEGEITHLDYKNIIIPMLEKDIADYHTISVMCDIRGVENIEARAIWDDFEFGTHHLKNFKRFAIVGDQWWVSPLMNMSGIFYKIDMKHFKGSQMEEARKWVNEK